MMFFLIALCIMQCTGIYLLMLKTDRLEGHILDLMCAQGVQRGLVPLAVRTTYRESPPW